MAVRRGTLIHLSSIISFKGLIGNATYLRGGVYSVTISLVSSISSSSSETFSGLEASYSTGSGRVLITSLISEFRAPPCIS